MTTREQILQMPAGAEMDALIATTVLKIEVDPSRCPYCGDVMWLGKERNRCTSCNEWRYSPYKAYSDDIAAAWEVVEKMHEKEFHYDFHGFFSGKDSHYAAFDGEDWADNNPPYSARAETLPLAICRAALLALTEVK